MERKLFITGKRIFRSFKGGFLLKRVEALKGVNIDLYSGEVVAVLGPNGSGKTTLIKCILGIIPPDKGGIEVFGHPPGTPEALKRIGYVPEKDPPWGRLKGKEVLYFAGGLQGLDKEEAEREANRLLEVMGLKKAENRKISTYSKGMKRRITIASALIHDPDVLILDEPTNGLDPIGSGIVLDILKELKKKGKGILLSSHLFREVEALADRIVILDRGVVVKEGSTEDVLADKSIWEIMIKDLDETGRRILEDTASKYGKVIKSGYSLKSLDKIIRDIIHEDK